MRESCTYGSVRGAGSNPRPYRDRLRNPGPPLPHYAEFIIGRRCAPTRWLHAGYTAQHKGRRR
jgi:hypothetical protein